MFEDDSKAFMAWLRTSGAEINSKIELRDLRHVQAGRGVFTTQDIAEEELLFRIPRPLVLSVENSSLSTTHPTIAEEITDPWLSLIVAMLYEHYHAQGSRWAPYLQVLPAEFNTLMFWDKEELDQLQASAVLKKIGKDKADEVLNTNVLGFIREHADLFHKQPSEVDSIATEILSLAHKAGSAIMAYAFDLEAANANKEVDEEGYVSDDEDEILPKGMIPLADMLNADADRNNARLFYEEDSVAMRAIKPIQAGEELFNDYGPLPRSDLLRRYGYITDNYAQYDVVEISLETITQSATKAGVSTATIDERSAYLDEEGIMEDGYDITTSSPFTIEESISPELIVLAEALLLPQAEFERLRAKNKLPKPEKISPRGAQLLLDIVKARAAEYPTALEQDMAENTVIPLAGDYTSTERRVAMAKLVRIGEKKILREAQDALTTLVQELGQSNGTNKRPASSPQGGAGKKARA